MKYICEHSVPGDKENRSYTISSNDKVDYIFSVLNKCGIAIENISNSVSLNSKGYYGKRKDKVSEALTIISGPTIGVSNKFTKAIQRIYSIIWLTLFLLLNCKTGEWVGVYHSVFTAIPVLVAQKLRKIHILEEVEEVFYGLEERTSLWRERLEKKVLYSADAYIFASDKLQEICNKNGKPYAIANGSYRCSPTIVHKRTNKCVLVYAGLIEYNKVAFDSIEIAKYLSSDYEIRIIGYGCDKDTNLLIDRIEEVNKESLCKVKYDGIQRGREYLAYLQSCDIGICPLTDNKTFQKSCFPSKITSYIANGLHVITTKNEVIENSKYSKVITFVQNNSAKEFAEAIMNLDMDKIYDARSIVRKLDEEFTDDIAELIGKMEKTHEIT